MHTLLFNKAALLETLTIEDCIRAVSAAHAAHATGGAMETNIVHADAPNGEYHIKTGGLFQDGKAYYGLKANGGFFNNRVQYGLPNIVGIIYLSDADNGYPLAVFESSLISKMRTAAATAVAAKYLAPSGPVHLGVIGYGTQASAQIDALLRVCPVASIAIGGRSADKAAAFAAQIGTQTGLPTVARSIREVAAQSNVLVTCTPARQYFIEKDWIQPGTFIAAVGADSPGKMELEPALMASARIVGDIKSQIIAVGESQHAINAGLIGPDDIYAELGELVAGQKPGRSAADELWVYDSTGTALQDIAVAAALYEKLKDAEGILKIDLFA